MMGTNCLECGKDLRKWRCLSFDKDIVCDNCINARVNFIAMLERETSRELRKYKGRSKRNMRDEPLGIICNRKDYEIAYHFWKIKQEKKEDLEKYSCVDLERARKIRGLSFVSLAAYLDISKSYLNKMEKGRKPLSEKAIRFIKEGINFSKKSKKSLNKYNCSDR